MYYGPDIDSSSNRNEYQGYLLEGKGGRCLWLTTLPFSRADCLEQCFSTAGPRPGTAPWYQLYRAARGSPGIRHFSFLRIFHEKIFYSGNILRRITFLNVSKSSDPDGDKRKLHYATRFH